MQRGETVLAFFSVVAISTNPSTVNNGANVIKKSEGQKVPIHFVIGISDSPPVNPQSEV